MGFRTDPISGPENLKTKPYDVHPLDVVAIYVHVFTIAFLWVVFTGLHMHAKMIYAAGHFGASVW